MATTKSKPELIVIVGPTASGKSELAMKIAQEYQGEIVSADSRMIYKGLDIGTGKPTEEERARVPHHLLDLVEPNHFFSVADYKKSANEAVEDILKRKRVPLLVGGSGLYIDSVLFDFSFNAKANPELRKKLESMEVSDLQSEIKKRNITPPLNYMNKRHLIRTIETNGKLSSKKELRKSTIVIGLDPGREELKSLIKQRNIKMIKDGLEQEVENLIKEYGKDALALDAIGYKEWKDYFVGKIDLVGVRERITQHSILYAKKQRTWFKRNKFILWYETVDSAYQAVHKFLNT